MVKPRERLKPGSTCRERGTDIFRPMALIRSVRLSTKRPRPKPVSGQLGKKNCLFSGLIDLVEDAAVGEMGGLGLRPTSEITIHGGQGQARELALVLGQDFGISRTIKVFRFDLLRRRTVKKFDKGFGR